MRSISILIGAAFIGIFAVAGCSTLPVTALRPGVYAALGDDPEEAINHANKFCRREPHKTIAVAVNDIDATVDKANQNEGHGVQVQSGSNGFRMNAGQSSGHSVLFQFSCQ